MVRGAGVCIPRANVPQFYCERQSDGLCRMHALNAYFGGPRLDRTSFEMEIANYDARQKSRGFDIPSAHSYDIVTGDQYNIISYILAKQGVFARIYEFSDRVRAIDKVKSLGVAFVYIPDHIWLIRRDDAATTPAWYKIDSLSGISRCDLDEIARNLAYGLIIPTTNLYNEFNEIASELNSLVMPDIVDYLVESFNKKNLLGNAETLIGAACSLLELQNNGRIDFVKLTELFIWYKEFTLGFSANCASLKFILRTVPQIIARILAIWRCGNKLSLNR